MSNKGFSHLGLSTLDLDKTREFYENVLGFKAVRCDIIKVRVGGQIRTIDPSGAQTVLTDFTALGVEGIGPGGLTVDPRGILHAAVIGVDLEALQEPGDLEPPDTHGVYRVRRDGSAEHVAGTEAMLFPNDVTLDVRGNVYATDTLAGAVWRVPRDGPAERWIEHDLLAGDGRFGIGFPVGANGIAFRHNRLIVANTERGLLVDIPILPDGRAGAPAVLVESPALVGVDGIALDVHGDVYAATGVAHTVVRVNADGSVDTLATGGDGLDQPSTLAFGTGRSDRQTLFIVNFAFFSPEPRPGVLKLAAGVPGQPVP